MRTRSRGGYTSIPTNYPGSKVNTDCTTGSVSHTLTFDYPVGELEEMHDVVTRRFYERSSRGEVIINPMSQRTVVCSATPGGLEYYFDKKPGQSCSYRETYDASPLCLNQHGSPLGHLAMHNPVGRLKYQAGTRAQANIDEPVFDGSVFVGELRETIRFLRNPLSSFNRYLSDIKKQKTRKGYAGTTASFLSDNWLSYRYAVRPLVNDIGDAAEAVQHVISKHKPIWRTARGYASASDDTSDSGTIGSAPGLTYTWSTESSRSTQVRAGVLYAYKRSPDTFGTSMSRIPVTGWELIPFSFVADWFVNIGPWIEAITPKAGIQVLGSWTTVDEEASTTRRTYISDGGYVTTSGTRYYRNIVDNCETEEVLKTTSKTRVPGINVGLTFNVSPLEGDIGKLRIVDLVALGRQLLSS